MRSYILQPNHVRGLGNILDNEDNIVGLHCRVQAQNTVVDFEEIALKTFYMGTGTELTITFITDSFSILPNSNAHIDVVVTDYEDNPVNGVDLYVYEDEEMIAQLETDNDGFGVGDELIGFDFSSATSGRHTLRCVLPRQDTYFESVEEVVINVFEETTLTLSVDPNEIDTLTDTITLYATLLGDNSFGIVGEAVKFYNGDDYLGEGITDDNGVATLIVNVSSLHDISPLLLDLYDSSNYTRGSGQVIASSENSIYLRAVGERWLNAEFTNETSYALEFDLILTKNNREGFYIGSNPNSDTKSGFAVVRDIYNTMVETYDSEGNSINLNNSLPSSYFNIGTHHIRIVREEDLVSIYFDGDLIFEIDEEIFSYSAEDTFYNTVGLFVWGSNQVEIGNFELSVLE